MGVPLLLSTDLLAIEGREHVEAVLLHGPWGERRVKTDGVILTGRFRPEAALIRASHLRWDPRAGGPEVDEYGRCSDPAFFAAGNLLRTVETAGHCWSEGRAVARAILAARAGRLPAGPGRPVSLEGEALAWVVPQRLAGEADAALGALQIGLARPARGRIVLRAAGAERAVREGRLLPERRLRLPLPPAGIDATVALEET